jgi:death-on-curing protein
VTAAIVWIADAVILAIHDEQLAQHGGAAGVRDAGLLESAMARPRQRVAYADPDLAKLAALHALAIARNHPFIDGNKRTALVALELFLALNGKALAASDADAVLAVLAMAAGSLSDDDFIAWVRRHT